MKRTEIQKRFDLINSKYNKLRGDIVWLILLKDGSIESGINDKEVKQLADMFDSFKQLVVDIASLLPSDQSDAT